MKPFVGMGVHYFEAKKPDHANAAIVINAGDGDRVTLVVFPHDAKPLLGVNDVGYAVQLKADVPCGDGKSQSETATLAWWSIRAVENAIHVALGEPTEMPADPDPDMKAGAQGVGADPKERDGKGKGKA